MLRFLLKTQGLIFYFENKCLLTLPSVHNLKLFELAKIE